MSLHSFAAVGLVLALGLATPLSASAEEPAPMPQTRGMQGMDPKLHDQWKSEGQSDPYAKCRKNADKAAQMAEHPMPQTRGMQGMDPKAHEYDCPEAPAPAEDDKAPPRHMHKGGMP